MDNFIKKSGVKNISVVNTVIKLKIEVLQDPVELAKIFNFEFKKQKNFGHRRNRHHRFQKSNKKRAPGLGEERDKKISPKVEEEGGGGGGGVAAVGGEEGKKERPLKNSSFGTLRVTKKEIENLKRIYGADECKILLVINELKSYLNNDQIIRAKPCWFPYFDKELYRRNGLNFIQSQFTAVRQQTKKPESTCLIFQNSYVMFVGLRSEIKKCIEVALQKICDTIEKPIRIFESKIVNTVVRFRLPFHVNIPSIRKFLSLNNFEYHYNTNRFTGVFIKFLVPTRYLQHEDKKVLNMEKVFEFYQGRLPVIYTNYRAITLLLFECGICSFLGNQKVQDWEITYQLFMGFFIHFSAGPKALSDAEVNIIKKIYGYKDLNWYSSVNFFHRFDINKQPCSEEEMAEMNSLSFTDTINDESGDEDYDDDEAISYMLKNNKFKRSDIKGDYVKVRHFFTPQRENYIFRDYLKECRNNMKRNININRNDDNTNTNTHNNNKNNNNNNNKVFINAHSMFDIIKSKNKVIRVNRKTIQENINRFEIAGDPKNYKSSYRQRYRDKKSVIDLNHQPEFQYVVKSVNIKNGVGGGGGGGEISDPCYNNEKIENQEFLPPEIELKKCCNC